MPCAANIGLLVRVFLDDRDFVEFFLQREIVVYVDPAPAAAKLDVVFR